MKQDPPLDVYVRAVHDMCDLAHSQESDSALSLSGKSNGPSAIISADLLLVVGNCELKQIQSGGDDCNIGVILNIPSKTYHIDEDGESSKSSEHQISLAKIENKSDDNSNLYDTDEKYKWISQSENATQDITGAEKKKPLTPTSCTISLAMIVHYLQGEDGSGSKPSSLKAGSNNALKWMCVLLAYHSNLQN
eukprot:6227269-Ditylum_brightwellii.AAC.1